MLQHSHRILKSLVHPTGLLSAASQEVSTGYDKAWLRDNLYCALGFQAVKDGKRVLQAHHAILDILLKHEFKIDHAVSSKPEHKYQYIHARYHPETMDEFWDEWGNKQNDAIGQILFNIGRLHHDGETVLRNEHDKRVIQKLVHYLGSIEYWHDMDNGMWEESEETHASSIGACVAGLKAVQHIVAVPEELIKKGEDALNALLPWESATKPVDLALLSLIYPYNVVNETQKAQILHNVESFLVRERGVIRYVGDQYYNKNGEAEWTFGFPWLAIIFRNLGDKAKYDYYMHKTRSVMNEKGELPELYFAHSSEHNENTPLAWSQAMYLVAASAAPAVVQ
jgi:GH15 family glucan-1,4-alpha-glucosidase